MCVVSSCDNKSTAQAELDRYVDSVTQAIRADREQMEKYQMIRSTPETKTVDVYFMQGESPFFDVYVLTDKSKSVDVAFFRAEDITSDGRIKPGKSLIRIFSVYIPENEMLKSWGYGGIDLIRPDNTIHHIDFRLINQPK